MSDHQRDLSDRTQQLMAESDLTWRQAWLQAVNELGPALGMRSGHASRAGRRSRTRHRASAKFTLLWVAAGFGFGLVPGIVSLVVRPGWGSSAVTQYANAGTAVYLVLLALSGLGVAAIGLRFGLMGRATEGWAAAVRMYGGVVVGTWLFVIIVDSGGYDVGAAAALLAIMIGFPYWVCAASGLVLGSEVFRFRTR